MGEAPQEDEESLEVIEGAISKVIFSNEESGWSVIRLVSPAWAHELTAVGNLVGGQIGEHLRLYGQWINDKRFGQQFKVERYLPLLPSTLVGVERYLASGLVEGIGPQMAKRLVKHFGEDTLVVLEGDGKRLTEVEGIGPKRAQKIRAAWSEQRHVKEVMIFLQAHGVSSAFATRIYKRYGQSSIAKVKENPYRLAMEVSGIGFKTADAIAERLGVDRASPQRAEAGLLHALGAAADDGHIYLPRSSLIQKASEFLGFTGVVLEKAIDRLNESRRLVMEPGEDAPIYLPSLYLAETDAAEHLKALLRRSSKPRKIDLKKELAWFESQEKISLAPEQRAAIERATQSKLLVITGGPGTGKTTIVNGVIRLLEKMGKKILLAAPTGRAAKRMGEATRREAKTIHRLLEFDPRAQVFTKCPDDPLEADAIILDEVSMVDIYLFASVTSALPHHAQLILVGDIDQLPSVGPGRVLEDVIASGQAEVVRLTKIFRQAKESLIVVNAHRINKGEMPQLEQRQGEDFYLIQRSEPEDVLQTIQTVVKNRIPQSFGLDPVEDVQVLTPMHRGSLGSTALNLSLQGLLNPGGVGLKRGPYEYKVGDKVMQTKNNYDLGVFNGDIGRIEAVDVEDRKLIVKFDERSVNYQAQELDELTLSYACSIHKSQGSEYPAVVIPISTQHFVMLHRNLFYTAVTRGKRLVVMVGSAKALRLAVNNHRHEVRYSQLSERLS